MDANERLRRVQLKSGVMLCSGMTRREIQARLGQDSGVNKMHSDSPWTLDTGSSPVSLFAADRPGCAIAKVYLTEPDTRKRTPEFEGNARLIAAAPELLSALETFMEMSAEPPEPNCSCHISAPCHDCVDHSGLREAFSLAREVIAKATAAEASRAEFDDKLEGEATR